MSDYTLIGAALELGGKVVAVEDCPPARAEDGQPADRCTLSMVHISPHVEYRAGARLLKAHKGKVQVKLPEEEIGAIRGAIKGFSRASRWRLMKAIAGIRLDADLPLFITLTYPESFPDANSSKKHLDTFFKRFARAFPSHGSIWKLEPQQRGAPHYHLLTWGCELEKVQRFVPVAWFEIAGGGDPKHLQWHMGGFKNQHCVQQVYNHNGVMRYASKYLGKTFEVEGWERVGRYWGIVKPKNIPFGELITEEITEKKALEYMRYQKRYAGLKRHGKESQTILCNDADQWIEKIGLLES